MKKYIYGLLLFVCEICAAQNVPYHILTTIATSPSDNYGSVFFDHNGLMWLGTSSGLKVYDGYTMKTFKSDAFSPGILPNNQIRCIAEDHQNCLWIGTCNGLVRMDEKTGKFHTFYLPAENQRIIYTLFCSKDGTIWIGTDGGLSCYLPKTNNFYTYNSRNTCLVSLNGKLRRIGSYSVKSIIEDDRGNLFLGTWNNGLMRFHRGGNYFYQYPKLNAFNSAYSLYLDKRHHLWVGTWGYGMLRIDHPENIAHLQIHQYPYKSHYFDTYYKIIEDPVTNTLWACSWEGVSILDENYPDAGWKNYTLAGGNNLKFSSDIATDKCGNIWIVKQNDDIVHINTNPSPFHFCYLNTTDSGLSINSTGPIYTLDGIEFWIEMYPYGLAYYNCKTGETKYNNAISGFSSISSKTLGGTFSSIIRRSNGELWFGSNSKGILVRKTNGKVLLLNHLNTSYITDDYVKALYESSDKVLWIGENKGVSIVYPDNKGFHLIPDRRNACFSQCDVRNITEDNRKNIWIATDNEGIFKVSGNPYHPKSLTFHQYNPAHKNFAVDDAIACYMDSHKRFWAISDDGGLFLYDSRKDAFKPMNQIYHINGDRVFSINGDSDGNLYLTTGDALVRLSFNQGKLPDVMSFSKEDGLNDFLCTLNSSFQFKDHVYIGSRTGFYSFIPKQLRENFHHKKCNLVITDLIIDDKPFNKIDSTFRSRLSDEAPIYTRRICIPSSIKKFEVEFALLTYSDPNGNKYAYQLVGYDKDWQYCHDGAHRAIYQNLPSGTYYLRLRAADHYGQWQNLPYDIEVKILPPWYATWWAFLFYLILLALTVYTGIGWYKRHLNTKNRLQMAVVFTNITHELLTPLTVISATIEDLQSRVPQFKRHYTSIQDNIFRLTYLLRQILEVKKSQSGQLKLLVSKGDLASTVRKICENIRPMTLKNHTRMTLQIPDEDVPAWFDADKVDKILYNLISNAIKYNHEDGEIKVSLEIINGLAKLMVSDNGIGMSKDKLRHLYTRFLDGDYRRMGTSGTGIGLSLTHDLVRLHHGRIDCRSIEGKGTTFTVFLPVRKQDYREPEIDTNESSRWMGPKRIPDVISQPYSAQDEDSAESVPPVSAPDEKSPEDGYKVLLVEDNTELLSIMKTVLGRQYQILTAKNGLQAWNVIQKEELDLVVSDVMMPVMDGIELTGRVKGDKDFAQLPIIILTARTSEEDQNTGYESGADEYLTKPFKMKDLQIRINAIIANRQRIRERFEAQTDLQPSSQHYTSPDEDFIRKAINCVNDHLDDPAYNREAFASDMVMGASSLYNKLRALTGQNIVEFITSIRLKKACQILRDHPDISVKELSIRVGFNTPKYFSKCFKKAFHVLPNDFAMKKEE
ncbi:MAG: response regulator [Prevotella sp.]|jgi:signal transduction histidine kinase/ligand-binding sensor domain-containing protein/DNA-binding NarL/FixJ family response regulator|nr:response regulator [Prevotella sp.]MCH4211458.1 response regulator [Prevotella sp.]MCH4240762.1 response regulator [Prevotella sp.]